MNATVCWLSLIKLGYKTDWSYLVLVGPIILSHSHMRRDHKTLFHVHEELHYPIVLELYTILIYIHI